MPAEVASVTCRASWNGVSTGRWDGDTLVVETTGFNGYTRLDTAGHPHSKQLKLTNTFRRVDARTIEHTVTVHDPKAYTRDWMNVRTWKLKPASDVVMEYSCEENNLEQPDERRDQALDAHRRTTMKTERVAPRWRASPVARPRRWTAQAHHSTAAEFDPEQAGHLHGHGAEGDVDQSAHLHVCLGSRTKAVPTWSTTWRAGAPNTLFRNGWRRDSLQAGDTVTVKGWRSEESRVTTTWDRRPSPVQRVARSSAAMGR